MHAAMNAALVPKKVTPARSAKSQSAPQVRMRRGCRRRARSRRRSSRPPTRKFHIIQPVVVNQKKRSPGCASRCRPQLLRGARAGCRRARGRSPSACRSCPTSRATQSGWSNGTRSNSRGSPRIARSRARRTRASASGRGTAARPCARASASRPASSATTSRCGRSRARRSGSRRPRAAPSARSARSGRSRVRAPKSGEQLDQIAPRLAHGEKRDDRSRGCSACRRRRGRPAHAARAQARPRPRAVAARSSPHVISAVAREPPTRARSPSRRRRGRGRCARRS